MDAAHGVPACCSDGSDPTILELWDIWFDEMSRGVIRSGAYTTEDAGKAARFRKDSDTILSTRKLVRDLLGDKKIVKATGDDWVHFNDTLRRLPNNHGRSQKLRHLSCIEFIERAEAEEERQKAAAEKAIGHQNLTEDEAEELRRDACIKRIAPRTFQRHQKYLCAPLDHAVQMGLLSHNPYKPYVLGEAAITELRKGQPETKRVLWTSSDFESLLKTDTWTSSRTEIDDPLYWVPIIARFHGLRSEEILQLKPKNIRCDEGVHYFEIERGTGQSTKSNNARRMVPLHSQLIGLGFLELVDLHHRRGKVRIFDKVNRAKTKKLSFTANFTKSFTYYRKTRGAYEERRDLHALRTTFHSHCIALAVPDTARRYLMGHRNDDVGVTNYLPDGFPLTTLKQYIEMQSHDLRAITQRFCGPATGSGGPRLVSSVGLRLAS